MALLTLESRTVELDQLLDDVCGAVQLTGTQYELAEERYGAVGKWLEADGSPLVRYKPSVYSQGSIRFKTTVKPRPEIEDEEYDVDLVCQLMVNPALFQRPMDVYQMVERRLRDSDLYKDKIEKFKRCLRINYANEFHLDITPACPDPHRGGTCILVPDKNWERWVPSNPIGYAQWFELNARRMHKRFIEKRMEPFPEQESVTQKAPLRLVVQLWKRHRDVVFEGHDDAPRSIVLTTLAAQHYDGQEGVFDALSGILRNVINQVDATPGMIVIPNPTNNSELFSESWKTNPAGYSAFVSFARNFLHKLDELRLTHGMVNITKKLDGLFGETPTRRAVESYMERMAKQKNLGLYAGSAASLTSAATRVAPIPKNTFYGA
jgi:hypothetical protein